MSRKHPLIPKGDAIALHLHEEYQTGREAYREGLTHHDNPYDFGGSFVEKENHTAWSYGWQKESHVGKVK